MAKQVNLEVWSATVKELGTSYLWQTYVVPRRNQNSFLVSNIIIFNISQTVLLDISFYFLLDISQTV